MKISRRKMMQTAGVAALATESARIYVHCRYQGGRAWRLNIGSSGIAAPRRPGSEIGTTALRVLAVMKRDRLRRN